MNGMGVKLLVVAICIFSVISCNKKEEPACFASCTEESEMNAVQPEAKIDENSVVATVNGKDILQTEVEKELQKYPDAVSGTGSSAADASVAVAV